MEPNKLAVVIPAYNEEASIRDIATRARIHCILVVVVNDGSTDNTASEVSGLDVVVLTNEDNLGKATALSRGFRYALDQGVSAVITLDADGQHRPEDIPKIVAASTGHPGLIIIGARLQESKNIPMKRYLANRFANFWIAWAAGYPITDSQSGFRLYPANILDGVKLDISKDKSFVFESEILIEAGWRGIRSVAVSIPAIYSGELRKSHFRSVADIIQITKMVGARLLSRGMYPVGFYRAFLQPISQKLVGRGLDRDAIALFGLSLVVMAFSLGLGFLWLLFSIIRTARITPEYCGSVELIVVPGHRLEGDCIPEDYRKRLDRAAILASGNHSARILILGGGPQGARTEAESGRSYLVGKGVSRSRIMIEEKSTNTLDNLRKAGQFLDGCKSIVVVSNRYHLERIATLARGLGLHMDLCAAEVKLTFLSSCKMLKEAFYLHWYWVSRFYGKLTRNRRILEKLT